MKRVLLLVFAACSLPFGSLKRHGEKTKAHIV